MLFLPDGAWYIEPAGSWQSEVAMFRNMGITDRGVRAILGVAAILLPPGGQVTGVWAWIAFIVGGILILTAAVGFCPLYRVFGWSTGKKAASPG
jgi:hypothetical protein